MPKTLHQIALHLAIESKASGFDDFGDLHDADDHGHLTEAEWNEVCDMAEDMIPDIPEDSPLLVKSRQQWSEANRAYRLEADAERRAFACDF